MKTEIYLCRCFVLIGTNYDEIQAMTERNPCSADTVQRPAVLIGSTLGESSPCKRDLDVRIHQVRVPLQFMVLY